MKLVLKIQLFQICIPATSSAGNIPPSLSTVQLSDQYERWKFFIQGVLASI